MAHNINIENGVASMFVVGEREDAWHLLGQRATSARTWQEAMQLAMLTHHISKVQNYARNAAGVVVPVDSYSIFRDDNNAQLGTVGAGFAVQQIKDSFQFIDTIMEANGGAHYDSAGALGRGEKIWCSVRIPNADYSIGKDKHQLYLVFLNGFDGSMARTVFISDVRPVCQNTIRAGINNAEALVKVKNTKNGDSRMSQVKNLMSGVMQDAATLAEKMNLLVSRKMTRESMVAVMNRLFPEPKETNANTTRRENVISEILELYSKNDNNAYPEQAGTAYNLLNAVTEYTDHFRTARETSDRKGISQSILRAENAVIGTGDKLKNSALNVILEETTDGRVHERIVTDVNSSTPILDSILAAV